MKRTLFLLLAVLISFSAFSQSDDLAFTVKKKKAGPITINWFDFDSLQAGQVYQIALNDPKSKIAEDSILCLSMDCKRYKANIDRIEYLVFGKDKPGKAYIALYSFNPTTKTWRQNSMRPVVFLDNTLRSK
ncbi:MAG: hypothetical protein JWO03_1396 [Bacteroidetes bacterium]|nr:hypothetical protein [Bacteroidota bacterium]